MLPGLKGARVIKGEKDNLGRGAGAVTPFACGHNAVLSHGGEPSPSSGVGQQLPAEPLVIPWWFAAHHMWFLLTEAPVSLVKSSQSSQSLGTARALKVTLTAQPIRLLGQHVGEPAKQNLLMLHPLTSLCLFIFPSRGFLQSKQGHIPQGFPVWRLLFGHTVGFSGWALRVGRYQGRGGWQGRKLGLVKSVPQGWLYLAQIKKPISPVAPSPGTYQSLCYHDLIFTAYRPLYGQKKKAKAVGRNFLIFLVTWLKNSAFHI